MQMGVEIVPVSEPVTAEARAALRNLDSLEPIAGKIEGSGPVFAFSHNTNAAIQAVNDILAAGGNVPFAKTDRDIYATGSDSAILQKQRRQRHLPQRDSRLLASQSRASPSTILGRQHR